jgi:hypothetical protein
VNDWVNDWVNDFVNDRVNPLSPAPHFHDRVILIH